MACQRYGGFPVNMLKTRRNHINQINQNQMNLFWNTKLSREENYKYIQQNYYIRKKNYDATIYIILSFRPGEEQGESNSIIKAYPPSSV